MNAINLRGVWNCMKYELLRMREPGSGAIVNCSSMALVGINTGWVKLFVPVNFELMAVLRDAGDAVVSLFCLATY